VTAPEAAALYADLADTSNHLVEAATRWAKGDLTDEQWEAEQQPWGARRENIRQLLEPLPAAAALVGLPEPLTPETWRRLPEERRDAIVATLIRRIRIRPPAKRGDLQPDLVGIDWVEDDVPAAELWPQVEVDTCSYCRGTLEGDNASTWLAAGISPDASAGPKAILCAECFGCIEELLWKADPRDVDPYQALRLFDSVLARRARYDEST
jgi:hypothetical protein